GRQPQAKQSIVETRGSLPGALHLEIERVRLRRQRALDLLRQHSQLAKVAPDQISLTGTLGRDYVPDGRRDDRGEGRERHEAHGAPCRPVATLHHAHWTRLFAVGTPCGLRVGEYAPPPCQSTSLSSPLQSFFHPWLEDAVSNGTRTTRRAASGGVLRNAERRYQLPSVAESERCVPGRRRPSPRRPCLLSYAALC